MCKKREHPSLYNKLKLIHDEGYLPFVYRFAKVTTFHVILEMLLTVYLLELFVFMSNFFLVDETISMSSSSFNMLIIPLIASIICAAVFGIVCVWLFANTVYKFYNGLKGSEQIDTKLNLSIFKSSLATFENFMSKKTQKDRKNDDDDVELDYVTKQYSMYVIIPHIIGILFYFCITIILPHVFLWVHPTNFDISKTQSFKVLLPILGTIIGAIWNVTGILRNQRLVWNELLDRFDKPNCRKKIAENNYKFLFGNMIGNIASIVFIFAILCLTVTNLQKTLLEGDTFIEIFKNYGALVITFITLLGVYIKTLFKIIYSEHEKEQCIYPALSTILSIKTQDK